MSQRGYLLWKGEELARFKPRLRETKIKTGFNAGSTVVQLSTPNHPTFTEWRRLVYGTEGRKNPLPLLPYCDELALAVWIMDDGNMGKASRSLIIATSSFSAAEHDGMIAWFKKRWDVQPLILQYHRKGRAHLALRFRRRDTQRIVSLVKDFIHPTMVYKLPLPPKPRRSGAIAGRPSETTTERWKFWFALLRQYAERRGYAQVTRFRRENGFNLGHWVSGQRETYREGRLPLERQQLLEGPPGWTWHRGRPEWDRLWQEQFAALGRFVEREGHARVPRLHREGGLRLGKWVSRQRELHTSGRLNSQRRRRLEEVSGWTWAPIDVDWEEGFGRLKQFVQREGNALVPTDYVENGFRLGQWVFVNRRTFRQGKLAPDRAHRLEELPGWEWHPRAVAWENGFAKVLRFLKREGHALVPSRHVEDGFMLGTWVTQQIRWHRAGTLGSERRRRLEALPDWSWGGWERGLAKLRQFADREGHTRVTRFHVEDGFKLGLWVSSRRQEYRKGTLDPKRHQQLEELPGWVWNPGKGASHD